MSFMNEYALLVAVALPVVAIVGIQVFLFIGGERATLLLPGFNRYPSIDIGAKVDMKPMAVATAALGEATNDVMEREAA